MLKQIAQRIAASNTIIAKNAKEAGKALQYFESILGPRTKSADSAYDPDDVLGEGATGSVGFKKKTIGNCTIELGELTLDSNGLVFSCQISTPFIQMGAHDGHLVIEGDTAAQLISRWKKELSALIKRQEDDIKEDQLSLKFLKSLVK